MFARSMMLAASLPLTVGFASDAFAQRRPDPPAVVVTTAVPQRYETAQQAVVVQVETPQAASCEQAIACAPAATTVIVKQSEPVDEHYGRRACAEAPRVVYVERPEPRVVVVERPAPRYEYYDRDHCRTRYVERHEPRIGFSIRLGGGCDSYSFRYSNRDHDRHYGHGRHHSRGGRGHADRRRGCR